MGDLIDLRFTLERTAQIGLDKAAAHLAVKNTEHVVGVAQDRFLHRAVEFIRLMARRPNLTEVESESLDECERALKQLDRCIDEYERMCDVASQQELDQPGLL